MGKPVSYGPNTTLFLKYYVGYKELYPTMTWYRFYMLHFTLVNVEGFQFDKENFENKTVRYRDNLIYYGRERC